MLITIPVVVTMVANETGVPLAMPCPVRDTVLAPVWNDAVTAAETPAPVTNIPTTKPVVLAIVTVVLATVVVPVNVTAASTP